MARLITGDSENHMQQQLWAETTEYVDNDVDVDDVDDDEEGAAAYFLVRDSDGHTNCELQECRGQAFAMGFSWASMQTRSYFIVICVDPNAAPKVTQVRPHVNACVFRCNSRATRKRHLK